MSKCVWVIDVETGDLVMADHMLDKGARIPKEVIDVANSESSSINLDWIKNKIERNYGYHN